ncbi:allophanate hydrolase subunit 1 [Williamsia sp. D3]|uniref:5-oxoprolinase subunit B family protein n=1 Tax=Williamsia sp. D3 TaxID=1313067 RepID=UPI0003D2C7BF|nr:allophanate hydrolase subunit 1 [Williamsia sp. D3]ETD30225.1 allophanate hydrolase [Williamsia sp. D3]
MTILAYGDRSLLIEAGTTEDAIGWTVAINKASLPGVVDVVPGARTVLVTADGPGRTGPLRAALERLTPTPEDARRDGTTVDLPVIYDGPDLDDIARLTGLSAEEVVAAHTGTAWQVAFGGFAPGFAYLIGGDTRLQVPRRDEARTKVPTGAVGLAGEFSGIYPRQSPGGWQLLGHTDLPMWDADRDPPALLQPGTLVRFRSVDS